MVIKSLVRSLLAYIGYEIRKVPQHFKSENYWSNAHSALKHSHIKPNATYSPWIDDIGFLDVYKAIEQKTLVDVYRCYELWQLVKQVSDVEGNILEVGVWRGGTGALLASAVRHNSEKMVFLADTFKGVVKAGPKDAYYIGGEHADASEKGVLKLIDSLNLNNTTILKGIFPDNLADKVTGNIAFLHCDVDVYKSTRDIVEWCLPRLSVGGVMVFDDYGFSGCEGVTEYCEELRLLSNLRFTYNLNGHAIFTKMK